MEKLAKPRSARGSIFSLRYHVVFVVKYRKKILDKEKIGVLKSIFKDVAKEMKCWVEEFGWEEDHIHFILETTPAATLSEVIMKLKGRSARKLFKDFPEIKNVLWGGHFWSPTYYIASVGKNSIDNVRFYIMQQAGVPK